MVVGEDCLSAKSASSAAAPYAALRPKEISGSGVAFSFPYFFWLRKRNRVVSRAKAKIRILQNAKYKNLVKINRINYYVTVLKFKYQLNYIVSFLRYWVCSFFMIIPILGSTVFRC